MKTLYNLIKEGNDLLGNRLIDYANNDGYIDYYFDDPKLWKNIIEIISDSLLFMLEESNFSEEIKDYNDKVICGISTAGINNVLKYYVKTLDTGTFLGTIKCYRKSYVDLILCSKLESNETVKYINFIERFFDRIEIISCTEWAKTDESEIKFNKLTEITSACIFMHDSERYIYANPAVERLTGYTKDEICRMKVLDLIHPEFIGEIETLRLKHNERGVSYPSAQQIKIITKNGHFKWIECNRGVVYFGEKALILGIAFDITDRKKAEENLKKNEKSYEKLVEFMPDAVYVYIKDRITYANMAGAKLLGASSPKEVIGKKYYDFIEVHPEYKALAQQQDDRIIREGTLRPIERKYIRKEDEKVLELEVAAITIPFEEDGAVLNISRDISERKKIEKLKEKVKEKTRLLKERVEYDKLKSEFFANISHELRTPLNVMLGSLQLLDMIQKEGKLTHSEGRIIKYKDIMKQNCYRLVKLVNNLIDMTKIDSGYYEIHMENYNIVSIVEDITLSVAEYIESHGIVLIFDTDVEERIMSFDPDSIERIMLNLLSNAVKFTNPGGTISVSIFDKEDNISISVKDTGIGIPKERQKDIFERFIQVDKSLSREREGSGIGLSLVKSLVQLHKGKLYVFSEEGAGSEFIVELPTKKNFVHDAGKNTKYLVHSNIERINVEFSDIYN